MNTSLSGASSSASTRCPGFGEALAMRPRRYSYHSQTSFGSFSKAEKVASSAGFSDRHQPSSPRNVGMLLSADIPAPVRTRTFRAWRSLRITLPSSGADRPSAWLVMKSNCNAPDRSKGRQRRTAATKSREVLVTPSKFVQAANSFPGPLRYRHGRFSVSVRSGAPQTPARRCSPAGAQ